MKPVNSFILFQLSCATSDINLQRDEGSQYLVEEAEVPYDALHIITTVWSYQGGSGWLNELGSWIT